MRCDFYNSLYADYNKDPDTAVIRLMGVCIMPVRLDDGRFFRFNDVEIEGAETMTEKEDINAAYDENGELCHWIIGFKLLQRLSLKAFVIKIFHNVNCYVKVIK